MIRRYNNQSIKRTMPVIEEVDESQEEITLTRRVIIESWKEGEPVKTKIVREWFAAIAEGYNEASSSESD